ncbi:hypothetical protein [Aquipuribacter nitratireducens]|uniref:ARB-07466-like C-terminal domain-containing protein n=1 Tax=Aquipuribacter nitratireducens TaxID=650104 RepID=A0ABW0GM65_9MICO
MRNDTHPTTRTTVTTRLRRSRALLAVTLAGLLVLGGSAAATAATPVPKPSVPYGSRTPDRAPGYQGQVTCMPFESRGAKALRDLLRRTYGANSGGILRPCASGGRSEHKEGRAYDWMLDASRPADRAKADAFLGWLTAKDASGVAGGNAQRLGVQYVIWDTRWWNTWTKRWQPYTGAVPHTDHVHMSLTWDGAYKRTSFWDGWAVARIDHGPCVATEGMLAPRYTAPNYTPCPRPRPAG